MVIKYRNVSLFFSRCDLPRMKQSLRISIFAEQGPHATYYRTRRERGNHVFPLHWIHLAAAITLTEKAYTTTPNTSSNHGILFP